jgi:hypothetical protein
MFFENNLLVNITEAAYFSVMHQIFIDVAVFIYFVFQIFYSDSSFYPLAFLLMFLLSL